MNKRKIIFRADGNSEIGLGHIIRSLALAEMLKDDFICEFATRFTNKFIQKEIERTCSTLHQIPVDEKLHFDYFLNLITGTEIVVLDNYFFTTEYQRQIKDKGCKLVCIDDLIDKHYYADLIINHAPGINKEFFSAEKYSTILTGLDYVILRTNFLNLEFVNSNKEESVIVCFGGADKYNITEKVVEQILGISGIIDINVIVSSSNNYLEKLMALAEKYNNIKIYQNISAKEIVEIGKRSKLAITSASTVSFEMLSLGLNLVVGYYIDNQLNIYNGLVKYKTVSGIGNLLNLPQNFNEIVLKQLFSDYNNLPIIDGKSGERILKLVKGLL